MSDSTGIDRRSLLKGSAVLGGAAAVWSAPAITTLGAAFAAGSEQPGGRNRQTYDLNQSFTTSGATGQFTLVGPAGVLTKPLSLVGAYGGQVDGVQGYSDTNSDASFPLAVKNFGTTTYRHSNGNLQVPPGAFMVHPGDGDVSPIKAIFTAPVDGPFAVSVNLTSADTGNVSYVISVAGTAVQSGIVSSGTPATYSATSPLTAGQPVEVLVNSNGTYGADSTFLSFVAFG